MMGAMDDRTLPSIIKRETVFSTAWFDVLAKTVSGFGDDPFYALRIYDYVAVVALTERGEILLVRQYRPAVEKFTLELPSGIVEPGEDPAEAAKRELIEETGYAADQVEELPALCTDSGRLANRIYGYFARDVKPTGHAIEAGLDLIVCSPQQLAVYIMEGQFDLSMHLGTLLLAVLTNRLPELTLPHDAK